MIVGITGRKRHGKDTCAMYLVEKYGFIQISFAQPLKEMCKVLFNFTDEQLYGDQKEVIDQEWQITPRAAFQYIGTELFRSQMKHLIPNIDDNFWVKCLESKINSLIKNNPDIKIVISDVRFPNEIAMIKQQKGTIIRVNRTILDTIDNHESEKLISELSVNYDIQNNNSLDDLYSQLDTIISNIK